MKRKVFSLLILFQSITTLAQSNVGLTHIEEGSYPGYVLFAPLFSKTTYLIDKCGKQVHTWTSSRPPGQSVYLLQNGHLLRAAKDSSGHFAGGGGRIEILDWNSKVLWSYYVSDNEQMQHHDICPMPNGNILVLAWEKKTADEAIKKGRNPKLLKETIWSEKIIELKPIGKNAAKIVWEWHVWDHLIQDFDETKEDYGIIADNPGRININYLAEATEDWLHFNAIDYNADLDQILISNRNFCEIFVLDHSTTTIESASQAGGKYGKGGDLLYRWGNPQAYNIGSNEDQKLFRQHNAHWIPKGLEDEGKIMLFNNGLDRPEENYSNVEIILPPQMTNGFYDRHPGRAFLPDTVYWKYQSEPRGQFFSRNVSSAQRLPNGNTFICEGANGKFFEVDRNGKIVWVYVNPVIFGGVLENGGRIDQNHVFRATLYDLAYKAFKKRNLVPGNTIENRLEPIDCSEKNNR